MLNVECPFVNEVGWYVLQPQTEEIVHLRREDGYGDTGGETYDNGVGHELDDGTHACQTHHDEQYARHDGCYHQPRQTILLNDAVDDDDKRTRRTAYLHLAAA